MPQTPPLDAILDGAGPEPIRRRRRCAGARAPQPPLQRENPDLLVPPATDAGTMPNLKYSFDAAHNRLLSGGWAREVTVRELPGRDRARRRQHAPQARRRSARCTGTRRPSGRT